MSMANLALQARWVVPVDKPPIAGGVVTIENGHIVSVGQRAESGVNVTDLGDVVLMPGLVNAHTHLEFSSFEKPLGQPGMSLPEWIRLVISSRKQPTSSIAAVVTGIKEALQCGTTTIGEIATAPLPSDSISRWPEFIAFQEVIGFSAARVESVFAELQNRLQSVNSNSSPGISPHAPYTVHPQLLDKLVGLAFEQSLPVAMHLAESPEELQLLHDNSGPFRDLLEDRSMWDSSVFARGIAPLDYLKTLAQAPRALVVHGNYLTPDEMQFIAQHREKMSVAYCPRTHTYFGHQSYPLPEMIKAGVCVAIGTDSRASNPDLSLLKELRHIAENFPQLSPQQIIELGTINGAEALGMTEQVGRLTPGAMANLTAIECSSSEESPLDAVLFGHTQPRQTWLRGELL